MVFCNSKRSTPDFPLTRPLGWLYSVISVLRFVAFFALWTVVPVHADTVRLSTGHWPPYLNESSEHHGLAGQVIREAFASQGISVEFVFLPWSRALWQARSDQFHGTAIWSCTSERLKNFLFSAPILPFRYSLYYRKSNDFDWEAIEDLEGTTIGLTQDYGYGERLEKAIDEGLVEIEMTTSDESNLRKLAKGRVDLVPMDPLTAKIMQKDWLDKEERNLLAVHDKPIREASYHVLFNPRHPQAAKLKEAFDNGLSEMRASGRLRSLVKQNTLPTEAGYILGRMEDIWLQADQACSDEP